MKARSLRKMRGFTLIELITVIAIIGILTALAIPSLLGHKEKARMNAVIASAKGSVAEIQSVMDAFAARDPFLIIDSGGNEICVESSTPPPMRTCQLIYRQGAGGSYGNINDIVGYIIANYRGKEQKSPYGSWWLFVDSPTGNKGEIVVTNTTARKILIKAYASDTTVPIFNSSVPQQ